MSAVTVTLKKNNKKAKLEATRVSFSAHQCFQFDGDPEETRCLHKLAEYLMQKQGLAVWGSGPLAEALFKAHAPLAEHVIAVVSESDGENPFGITAIKPNEIENAGVKAIFLAETKTYPRMQMRKVLPPGVDVIEPDVLTNIALDELPARAWTPIGKNIYPIDIPEIRFEDDLDMLLIDCPARNLSLMPNGLGYVHNTLKKTTIKFQTFDLDIVTYHRFHIQRLFDEGGVITLPSGRSLPTDPWQAEHYDWWQDEEVIEYFSPIIEEAANALIKVKPKILGLSIHQCNEAYSRELVNRVKKALPDITIIVGGFSCYNPEIGLRVFPEADYMCIGECELTVAPLVESLARSEQPKNMPGILSRFDDPDWNYIPGPMPHNLDEIEFPKYEWFDLDIYRNFNGYQLTPIIASRGCRWSRCTFCAERFFWRIRSAANFVDELEWLIDQGCTVYMFNESDLNGMPERVLDICDEVLRRDLHVKLTGQLRIHKKSNRDFFQKLSKAGFVALRFGIDAFSTNTLRLQKKGYTVDTIRQNMKDCWEAGIFTEVNWVIGVPGETEEDTEEGIALILEIKDYIGRLANINPLILVNGGVYWLEPEEHNIKFLEPKEDLYEEYPRAIPADKWYSEEPYIDAQVRKQRFEHIVISLHDSGFPVGEWARRIIDDVKTGRDKARTGEKAAENESGTYSEALPSFIRSISSYKLFRHDGEYYALPHVLGDVDLAKKHIAEFDGVIRAGSEEELAAKIEEADQWADTRGQYDAQRTQKKTGTYMRAGSFLGDDEIKEVSEKPVVFRYRSKFFALDGKDADALIKGSYKTTASQAPVFSNTTPLRRIANTLPSSVRLALVRGRDFTRHAKVRFSRLMADQAEPRQDIEMWGDVQIMHVVSNDAAPQEQGVFGNYNLIEFDGMFYAIPFGAHVDWKEDNIDKIPGVIAGSRPKGIIEKIRSDLVVSEGVKDASISSAVERTEAIDANPVLLGDLKGYNIVSYEGWVYGIPQELGALDLTEVDVIEMDGVIRDVSRDVVESHILELTDEESSVAA